MLAWLPSALRSSLPSIAFVSYRGFSRLVDMELTMTNDEIFAKLQSFKYPDECKHLVKKYLTPEIYAKIKDKKTKLGGTLGHCIVSGVIEPSSTIAFLACDPESYEVFAPLVDLIIRDYHKVPPSVPLAHPKVDYGDLNNLPFGNLDPTGDKIVSTRVRVGRSLQGYCMVTTITKAARLEMEGKVKKCLEGMTGEHKGTYYKLDGMNEATKKQLIEDHFLFSDAGDKYNKAAGVYRDWPLGRGIFHNDKKTFLVWNNEEDHLRIISMEMGGDLAGTYRRMVQGIKMLEKATPFAHSDRLGWLTCCPTNLGTALRASVHARVPKLSAKKEEFDAICEKYNIQARGIHGEHTESVGGVYDLSNKRRLGISELEAVNEMAQGVQAILAREAAL